MENLYCKIIDSEDLFNDYNKLTSLKLKSIYGFMCACMSYFGMIYLEDDFAALLYIDLVENQKEIESSIEKIYSFIENKSDSILKDEIDEELKDMFDEV